MVKGKRAGGVSKPAEPAKGARQKRLPGMEDAKLEELHGLAEDYAKVRDQRIALNAQEKPLKDSLLAAMHKHKRTHYKHNGLEITVVPEGEKLRVRIKKDAEEDEDTPF